jgi:hypothetical protein
MRFALRLSVASVLVATVACGFATSADSLSGAEGRNPGDNTDANAGTSQPPPGLPSANGIVLAHAATFPTMRLCFGAHMEMRPQPDTEVMPGSNVVGIEIGNVARLPPLDAVGDIYVIDERRVRSGPNTTGARTCSQLLTGTTPELRERFDYHKIEGFTGALGQDKVEVLAVSGCGQQLFVQDVGGQIADCGPQYDTSEGNLKAQRIALDRTGQATDTKLPALVVNLSPLIDAVKGPTGTVEVSYGDLQQPGQVFATNPPLFGRSQQALLNVDQTQSATYGTHGFKVFVDDKSGPGPREVIRNSLAVVQEVSSPGDVPSSYYRVASNYALLLLGDPRHIPVFYDGGPNAQFDPRKGVHIIAVPVLDPERADAGFSDASPD